MNPNNLLLPAERERRKEKREVERREEKTRGGQSSHVEVPL